MIFSARVHKHPSHFKVFLNYHWKSVWVFVMFSGAFAGIHISICEFVCDQRKIISSMKLNRFGQVKSIFLLLFLFFAHLIRCVMSFYVDKWCKKIIFCKRANDSSVKRKSDLTVVVIALEKMVFEYFILLKVDEVVMINFRINENKWVKQAVIV